MMSAVPVAMMSVSVVTVSTVAAVTSTSFRCCSESDGSQHCDKRRGSIDRLFHDVTPSIPGFEKTSNPPLGFRQD
jgi:hypothetical protein